MYVLWNDSDGHSIAFSSDMRYYVESFGGNLHVLRYKLVESMPTFLAFEEARHNQAENTNILFHKFLDAVDAVCLEIANCE